MIQTTGVATIQLNTTGTTFRPSVKKNLSYSYLFPSYPQNTSLLDLLPPPSLLALVLPCPLRHLPSVLALPCLGLCRLEPRLCLLLPFRWPSDRRRLENFPPPRPRLLPLPMLPPPLRSRLCP